MSYQKTIETKLRGLTFESTEAARKALKENAFAGDFLLEFFVRRGVLQMQEDGVVKGVPVSKRPDPKHLPKNWGLSWPEKDLLAGFIEDHPEGVTMAEIKAHLEEYEEPHGHWVCVHSLRRLASDGLIYKDGMKYRLKKKPVAANSTSAAYVEGGTQ